MDYLIEPKITFRRNTASNWSGVEANYIHLIRTGGWNETIITPFIFKNINDIGEPRCQPGRYICTKFSSNSGYFQIIEWIEYSDDAYNKLNAEKALTPQILSEKKL